VVTVHDSLKRAGGKSSSVLVEVALFLAEPQ